MSEFYARYDATKRGWFIYKDSGRQAITWAGPYSERAKAEGDAKKMNTRELK